MGTKGYIKIQGCDEIIGMTSSCSLDNLVWIAKVMLRNAINNGYLTQVRRGSSQMVNRAANAVVQDHKDWLFFDSPNNPEWVSYSAKLTFHPRGPHLAVVKLYEGDFRSGANPIKIVPITR